MRTASAYSSLYNNRSFATNRDRIVTASNDKWKQIPSRGFRGQRSQITTHDAWLPVHWFRSAGTKLPSRFLLLPPNHLFATGDSRELRSRPAAAEHRFVGRTARMKVTTRPLTDAERRQRYRGVSFFSRAHRRRARAESGGGLAEELEFEVAGAWNLITCEGPPCCPNTWIVRTLEG